uniref:GUN4-like domain-containing protein n=1 Tax=Alsidium seaforthii TaxID=2007182 RepID=A0A1Z1MD09_9FLOR|nr:hypothetical protein [Bryothamnion seaforthii]ARW63846.1 hypothetical protein [Bryothamnion seaforthii]
MQEDKSTNLVSTQNIESIFNKKYYLINSSIEKKVDEICKNGQQGQNLLLQSIKQKIVVNKEDPDIIDGFIFQALMNTNTKSKLIRIMPNGVLNLRQSLNMNYQPLQDLLINQEFKEADKITQKYLCHLAQLEKKTIRKWLYFTDIQLLPIEDLFALDKLWRIYSKGKFGFSVQKKIWINSDKNWDKMWEKVYWQDKGIMRRYPQEFIWTTEAPEGHLPLFNQLRGTQTLRSLFNIINW